MKIDWRKNNSLTHFFYLCPQCDLISEISIENFLEEKIHQKVGIKSEKLEEAIKKGTIKFYHSLNIPTLQFKKGLGKIEEGTVIYLTNNIQVIRGFPKIRRTLLLSPSLENYFPDQVAVEEKMNGYNVRLACLECESDSKDDITIIALTRGGYICPFTTKKAQELMDLSTFFQDNPDLVLCGEMVGTANPYVSHHYEEIGNLGFRVFDIRQKLTNQPLSLDKKRKLLEDYGLPVVRLYGIFPVKEASEKIKEIVKQIGLENREGVVMKQPEMELSPLKYTSSQAHNREIKYAFNFPFDFGRAFFFSRVIREGFQAYEMEDSPEELRKRAQRMGESIIYPMLKIIQDIAEGDSAIEDTIIEVDNQDEAEEFMRHLHDLGVSAVLEDYNDGKAVIRRIHQSTNDKIRNYLKGGLY
ncbi:RNA ligase [Methanobacterium alkalithermotolerans]|uniref:RNA ligase n=1 Tax=Methanobacterium alkalithermotolerans TaxID=2731220 RepID=A0A8T8K5E0_9EURY|nr:RNA ligase [Methanobacterium alkalithermotolerans]QUH23217.1 RNA ligase [Methanobacterium alkalithermotolerans]